MLTTWQECYAGSGAENAATKTFWRADLASEPFRHKLARLCAPSTMELRLLFAALRLAAQVHAPTYALAKHISQDK